MAGTAGEEHLGKRGFSALPRAQERRNRIAHEGPGQLPGKPGSFKYHFASLKSE